MNMRRFLLLPLLSLPLRAKEFKRELSPDRPDTTENPISVEPGGFQVESSLWSFAKDGSDETWSLGETNLKAGLTENTDLQLVLTPWVHEQTDEGTSEGFGDVEVRLKWNLWGNDGGKTAGALLPFVSVPTRTAVSSGEWEGGIIFPVSVPLTDKLDLGFQVSAERAWNGDDGEYDWDVLHSIVLGIQLTESVGTFIEYVGVAGDGNYEASMNTGITWGAGDNLQFDVIVGAGINRAAEDFSIAQGVTFRF